MADAGLAFFQPRNAPWGYGICFFSVFVSLYGNPDLGTLYSGDSGASIGMEVKREVGANPTQDRCCIRRET